MSSLMEDLVSWYDEEKYPPSGTDLDLVLDSSGKWTISEETNTTLVSKKDNDTARWGTWFTNVYQRGDEFVAVKDCRPATENQDWGDYGKPEIFPVDRIEKVEVVVSYERSKE